MIKVYTTKIDKTIIAPCGMNCGVCRAYLRDREKCPGCGSTDEMIFKYCMICRIRNCEELRAGSSGYCFSCEKFPCARLRQLDKRYRIKYDMSMIDNLNMIKDTGIDRFMVAENKRWACEKCGSLICVHNKKCSICGFQR